MEWLLIAWFVTSTGVVSPNQNAIATRVNTKAACNSVLQQGYNQNLRGICVHDPVQR